MQIKKLTNSSVLKRGESLIVLKCSKRYHDDVLSELGKSLGTRFVQFYRHRQEAVPWVSRWKNGRCFRHPRTTNERRANCAANTTREIFEDHGIAFKIRPNRSWRKLPTTYDDIFLQHQRSWKEHRRTQFKNADGINRRIHSPSFRDAERRVKFGSVLYLPVEFKMTIASLLAGRGKTGRKCAAEDRWSERDLRRREYFAMNKYQIAFRLTKVTRSNKSRLYPQAITSLIRGRNLGPEFTLTELHS